jgi:hypothetical protein
MYRNKVHTKQYIKRHFQIGNQTSKLKQKQQKEKKSFANIIRVFCFNCYNLYGEKDKLCQLITLCGSMT